MQMKKMPNEFKFTDLAKGRMQEINTRYEGGKLLPKAPVLTTVKPQAKIQHPNI